MLEAVVDPGETIGFLGQLSKDFPWACSVAINRTVELGLEAMRTQIKGTFTSRVPAFLPPQQLPNAYRATPDKLWAELRVGYDTGAGSLGARVSSIYSKFEEGGIKAPTSDPNLPSYIPTRALRPNKTDVIRRELYPKKLMGGLAKGAKLGTRARSIYGYFLMGPEKGRAWGIWERFGTGDRDIRMIWAFRKTTPLPASLHFYETGMRVVQSEFDSEFGKAWDYQVQLAGAR